MHTGKCLTRKYWNKPEKRTKLNFWDTFKHYSVGIIVTETLTNQSWGRVSNSTCACCEGLNLSTKEIKIIKCLQEKNLPFVRGWHVHVTPAASKEIRIIFTHFTSMNLSGKKIYPHMWSSNTNKLLGINVVFGWVFFFSPINMLQ